VNSTDANELGHLLRASDLIGLPVVTIDGGDDVAEVRDVVYDANRHQLIGFTLNKRGWLAGRMKDVLQMGDVAGLGSAAVMISDDSVLGEHAVDGAAPNPGATVGVAGNTVMTDDGTALGEVRDVIVEAGATATAVGYEIETPQSTRAFIPISAQMALSNTHLVVPASSTEFVRNDLAGFGAALDSFRAHLGEPHPTPELPTPSPADRVDS
jgi:uncharacterized protein YrrD